jgi:hypothetical protein
MISVQAYPVMDGVELWVAGMCTRSEDVHIAHKGGRCAIFLTGEELDRYGSPGAVAMAVEAALVEFPEIGTTVRC